METEDLGRLLKARRTAAGRTIASVAVAAGLSVPYIANLENGRGNPTVAALAAIAGALGATLRVELADSKPAELPEVLIEFAKSPRFVKEVGISREQCLTAMAAMAALSSRPLSESDCHRLLDAIVLMKR